MLPINTDLGKFKILKVYEKYDGPKIFTVINNEKEKFLVYWCESSRHHDKWLYLRVSEAVIKDLEEKRLSLYKAFVSSKQGIYIVTTNYNFSDDVDFRIKLQPCSMYLPPENIYLQEYIEY